MKRYPIIPRGWKSLLTVKPQPEPTRKWWNVDYPIMLLAYRIAEPPRSGRSGMKFQPPIVSQRRQARKLATERVPALRSGRQWKKYRKQLKKTGLDFLSLPTYKVRGAK